MEQRVPEERPPIYDFSQLRKFVGYLERDNESWDSYLRSQASHALEITYEQLIADYQGNVRRALDHIGAFGCDVPTPPIQKQADEINEDWVERFQTDVEEFGF